MPAQIDNLGLAFEARFQSAADLFIFLDCKRQNGCGDERVISGLVRG
jgi:hypothetical protein